MSNLIPPGSSIALHLTDRALTPIISTATSRRTSSSQTQTPTPSLSTLTTAALTAYEAASRLGLGAPQRLMIETLSSGPIVLHSFLNPQSIQQPRAPPTRSTSSHGILEQAREDLRPLTGTTDNDSAGPGGEGTDSLVNGVDYVKEEEQGDEQDEQEEDTIQQPPLLIATAIAPTAADLGEARRAAARLERMGRSFQREWLREQEELRKGNAIAEEEEDG